MLEVTVKTLDSQSRKFSVPDDITIQGFKSHIAGSVNISAERQRIIYQGRVLRDEDKLNASGDINGKVVHLVERLPTPVGPSSQQAPQSTPRTRMGTPVSTMPHGFTASAGNVMGPFPAPGGNFNSHQFVEQMLQQAFSGMGGRPMGPTVVRGSVRHPTAPGQDARTEIQIHITPQGREQGGQVPSSNSQPAASTNQPSTNQQQSPASQRQTSRTQPVISEPRRQLNYVEYLITKLEEHIGILESGNFEQAKNQESTSDAAPGGATDSHRQTNASGGGPNSEAAGSSTSGQSASAGSDGRRHPTLPEVGRVMRRVTSLETKFLPFLTEYTDFLEKDPAYSSTQSQEYRRMMGFANTVLRAQRAISIIHRVLSSIVIPLSETPPRSMLVQGECQRHRVNPPPHARQVHNVSNLATAGQYLNNPQANRNRQARPHGPYQFRMPMVFGPFRAPGPVNARMMGPMPRPMFRFGPIVRSGPPPPHQSGLYGHPPAPPQTAMSTATTQQRPALPPTRTSASVPNETSSATTSTQSSGTRNANATSTQSPTTNGTLVEIPQPEYAVQVTTHIQPNININITPGPFASAVAASQEGVDESIQVEGFSDTLILDGEEHSEDAHMDGSQEQMFGFQGSIQTDEEGNVTIPMEASLPNIPGISQDAMRQIIQSVQGSVQQVMNVVNQGDESGSVSGPATTHQDNGRISVQGLPGGQNQIPLEIANIIGQTVQNIMLNHLNTDQQNTSAQHQDANTSSTTSTADTNSSVTTSPNATVQSSSSVANTVSDSASDQENTLLNLLAEIGGGQFGTRPCFNTAASPNPTASEQSVEGAVGGTATKTTNFKMPPMNPVPNSINAMVQGQFPVEGMIETCDPTNILSLLIFVAGELLTVQDAMRMMAGDTDAGNRLREPLRQGISENWFNGRIPNSEEIETEVDRQSEDAKPVIIKYFDGFEAKSPDIGVVESNLSLFRHVVRRMLHIIFIHDAEQFSVNLLTHVVTSLSLMFHLNMHILRGSENDVVRMFAIQLESLLAPAVTDPDYQPPLGNERIRSMIAGQIIPFTRARQISQDQIDQFVMNAPPSGAAENDADAASTSTQSQEKVQDSTVGTDVDMEKASTAPLEKKHKEKKEDEGATSQPESSGGAVGGVNTDWRTMVPQEWVSVMNSDIEKQKNLPEQPSYSEAYMAGMPASKRRKI